MSGNGLVAALLMVGMVMLVMSFWRQILMFMLSVVLTVFCFGVCYIAYMITYVI